MNDTASQTANRPIDAVTRRSLRALGGAALLGALARPPMARAGKAGKKARARCRRQEGACEAEVRTHCGELQGCLEGFLPCCRFLATCQAGAYVRCTFLGE